MVQFREAMRPWQTTAAVGRQGDYVSGGPVDWDALQPITRGGLQLFRKAAGRVLEGVSLTPPVCNVRHTSTPSQVHHEPGPKHAAGRGKVLSSVGSP